MSLAGARHPTRRGRHPPLILTPSPRLQVGKNKKLGKKGGKLGKKKACVLVAT